MDTSNRCRRARTATLRRGKPPTPPRSPSPTRSPFCRTSDTSLPLKRELLLKPSAELHVNAPKLPVVNRKEAVPVNEDEQEEEDTPVPPWLSLLRDRRNHPTQHHHNTQHPTQLITRPNTQHPTTQHNHPTLSFYFGFFVFWRFFSKTEKIKKCGPEV